MNVLWAMLRNNTIHQGPMPKRCKPANKVLALFIISR